jgi:hypothetical protein
VVTFHPLGIDETLPQTAHVTPQVRRIEVSSRSAVSAASGALMISGNRTKTLYVFLNNFDKRICLREALFRASARAICACSSRYFTKVAISFFYIGIPSACTAWLRSEKPGAKSGQFTGAKLFDMLLKHFDL